MLNINEYFTLSKACYFLFIYRKTELIKYKICMRCPYWYFHLNLYNVKYVFVNVWTIVHSDTKHLASITCVLRGTTTVYATYFFATNYDSKL